MDYGHIKLLTIFLFVLAIIVINRIFWFRRTKLWHETARLALEKGQPVPNIWDGCSSWRSRGGWGGRAWDFRRGLVLIAVGCGLYLGLAEVHPSARFFAAIPAFMGVALLVSALMSGWINRNNPNPPDDRTLNR